MGITNDFASTPLAVGSTLLGHDGRIVCSIDEVVRLLTHRFQFSHNRVACLVICHRKSDHEYSGSLEVALDTCCGTNSF